MHLFYMSLGPYRIYMYLYVPRELLQAKGASAGLGSFCRPGIFWKFHPLRVLHNHGRSILQYIFWKQGHRGSQRPLRESPKDNLQKIIRSFRSGLPLQVVWFPLGNGTAQSVNGPKCHHHLGILGGRTCFWAEPNYGSCQNRYYFLTLWILTFSPPPSALR